MGLQLSKTLKENQCEEGESSTVYNEAGVQRGRQSQETESAYDLSQVRRQDNQVRKGGRASVNKCTVQYSLYIYVPYITDFYTVPM